MSKFLPWIFDMSKLRVSRVNVSNWHNGRNQPLVRSSTVEIGPRKLYRSRRFIGSGRTMKRERLVCIICITNLHLIRCLRIVSLIDIVRQPLPVPLVDLIKVGCVIFGLRRLWNGAQIAYVKCVHGGDFLQMNGIVEVVQPKGARSEPWKCFVEEASVGAGVGAVRGEVDGRCVQERIGRDVGHGGQKVIHHARIVGVVDGWTNETALQDVTPEERSTQGHVVQMQQSRSIREHGINVDLFNVG